MPNFSIALSGLQADSVALNTVGNNLANLNTTAYKEQGTTFEDLFYQQVGTSGAGNPLQVGVGTRVSGTSTSFDQGTISPTAKSTDVALSGDGFFVVQQDGVQSLTRAGNFQLDLSGNLTTINGESVMGYPTVGGVVGSSTQLVPLSVPVGETEPAQATQNITMSVNLNSVDVNGASISQPVNMFDTLGQSHSGTVTYTKTSATTWNYAVTLPPGDNTGATTGNTGTLTFDSTGRLVTPTTNVTGIGFAGMTDGASPLSMSLNLYDASGNPLVGESASKSNVATSVQDGYASGAYQKFSVDASGTISATFSNGHTTNVGQIAVAKVVNPDGLVRTGHNNFETTAASGTATLGVAGAGGRATVQDFALELSNVDISTEFSNLIIAQRAFEANSKTVTTFDTVTQDAISMIR